jgi:anti-anti-sigma factor
MQQDRQTPDRCEVRAFRKDAHVLLILNGSLVLQNSEMVRGQIHKFLSSSCDVIDLSLHHLGFIDSSGLGVLVGFHVMAKKKKIEFRLLSPTPNHLQLFEATRLSSVFTIVGGAQGDRARDELEKSEFEVN